jgi:hypothetical protein
MTDRKQFYELLREIIDRCLTQASRQTQQLKEEMLIGSGSYSWSVWFESQQKYDFHGFIMRF